MKEDTMKVENLDKAARLARDVEWLERDLVAYRNVDEISVAAGDYTKRDGGLNLVVMTAAEIGDAVVEVLSRRLAKMRAELRALGVVLDAAGDQGRQ
jgi:hypothetical protein